MKIFKNSSKLSASLLLLLLLLLISGIFLTLHNQLSQAEKETPMLAVILTIGAIAVSIYFFQQTSILHNRWSRTQQQLEQLKQNIQESKREKEKEDLEMKEAVNVEVIDFDKEAEGYIPTNEFENEDLFMEKLLSNISKRLEAVQAISFKKDETSGKFSILATYAYFSETDFHPFTEGETLPGQVAKNKEILVLSDVPKDYITILSGMGKGSPKHLLIAPILNPSNECIAVVEIASFSSFDESKKQLLNALCKLVSKHLLTIGTSTQE